MPSSPQKRRLVAIGAVLAALLVAGGLWLALRETTPAAPEAPAAVAEDAGPTEDEEPAAVALAGSVIERSTRRGVPDATVEARCEALGDEPRRAPTDERGRFAFEWLPDGTCALSATAPGHVAGGPGAARPIEVRIREGQPLTGVEVRLFAAASVTGKVVAGDTPVEGVALTVLYLEAPEETESYSVSPEETTGADGGFTLPALGPGRVQILAEHDDYALAQSDELFLKPGQRVDGVVIRLAGGGEIVGRVTDERGTPLADVRVRLVAEGTRGVRREKTDRNGGFLFEGVAPGRAMVMASAVGYSEARREGIEVVAGETAEVALVLASQVGFGGVVRAPDGHPVPSAAVHVVPAELPPGHSPLRPVAYTDDDGRFWVARVPDAASECFATHPEWAPSPRVPVPDGGGQLELVLGAGGRLTGRVVDDRGAPVPTFTVALSSFRGPDGGMPQMGGLPRSEVADPSGQFAFEGLAPGTYDVRVLAPGYPPVLSRNHEVVADRESDTGPIVVTRGGAVVGTVTDAATGGPIAGAMVRGAGGAGGGAGPLAVTDADGRFRLDGLAPERLSLRVQARGYVTKLASGIEVPGGGEADAGNIALASAGADGGFGRMQYSGIGAVLSRSDDALVIQQAFEGSPSAQMGLAPGTEIRRINGEDTAEMDLRQAVEVIRGEAGTELTLEVVRPGQSYPEIVRVERGEVVTPPHPGGRPRPQPRMPPPAIP